MKKEFSKETLKDAKRELRLALLEADVYYPVAKEIVHSVSEKLIGKKRLAGISPAQQFAEVLHAELVAKMGSVEAKIHFSSSLSVFLLCGLQGSGKTSTAAKLGHHFSKQGKKVALLACDLQRPAATQQLKILGEQANLPVFFEGETPLQRLDLALKKAQTDKIDILIVDTAGRIQLDDELMNELQSLKAKAKASETLFVANAAMGQEAHRVALAFDEKIGITGSIITMLDGDARAGAAISLASATGKALKFEGTGERIDDLQIFNPHSMADRILGMGDQINLVKKLKEQVSQDESKAWEKKLRSASFTYDDFLKQMKAMKRMGPLQKLMQMMPSSMSAQMPLGQSEEKFKEIESIICSMTPGERHCVDILSIPRKNRLAKGSGCSKLAVDQLIKFHKQSRELCKKMPSRVQLENMKKKLGGSRAWH